MDVLAAATAVSLLVWTWLWLGRGGYWRTGTQLSREGRRDEREGPWPSVVAVVPARDEAEVLPRTLPALLGQVYPGPFRVCLVDDCSRDGTGDLARELARAAGRADRLTVIEGTPLQRGWTGKLWALEQGLAAAEAFEPQLVLFTDADIRHSPDSLITLVEKACGDRLDLVSLMAELRADGWRERLLVSAFVYFFGMIYPFAWVNDPTRPTAAAAGGCLLVRTETLRRSGGLVPIRGRIIDDCALARQVKASGGRIWLGLARHVASERGYGGLAGVWATVTRTAYAQLHYSPFLLLAAVAGMGLVYVLPPLGALSGALAAATGTPGGTWTAAAGAAAWALMARTYGPMLHWYGVTPLFAPILPAVAGLYTLMTIHSAWQHERGEGGRWKGRLHAG